MLLEPISPQMRQRLEDALKTYEAALLQKLVQTYGERAVTETFKANERDIAQATIPLVRLQQILREQEKPKPSNLLVRLVQSAIHRWARASLEITNRKPDHQVPAPATRREPRRSPIETPLARD
jgi:hypothetical protein